MMIVIILRNFQIFMAVSVEIVVLWAVKLPGGYHEEHVAFIFNVNLSVVRMWPGFIYIYIYTRAG
jgi:hypothetical protein